MAPRPLRLCNGIHNPEASHQSLHETILLDGSGIVQLGNQQYVCLAGERTQIWSTFDLDFNCNSAKE